jgi:hypothetical protein
MKYIGWLLGVVLGTLMVIKTEWIVQNFGTNAWAEQHLGTSGGSRLMYKLVGLVIIFISMMGLTGMLGPFIIRIFGGLFGL